MSLPAPVCPSQTHLTPPRAPGGTGEQGRVTLGLSLSSSTKFPSQHHSLVLERSRPFHSSSQAWFCCSDCRPPCQGPCSPTPRWHLPDLHRIPHQEHDAAQQDHHKSQGNVRAWKHQLKMPPHIQRSSSWGSEESCSLSRSHTGI